MGRSSNQVEQVFGTNPLEIITDDLVRVNLFDVTNNYKTTVFRDLQLLPPLIRNMTK
jgi:hypothetical protein